MLSVDLNCDLGEGFGPYRLGDDVALMPYLSSVNIACGVHAGDPALMRQTVADALAHGLAIGAHPGLPDRQGFGRRELAISPQEAYALTLYQVGALQAFVLAAGGRLHHVKPHGALYNMAARDRPLAQAIAQAVKDLDPSLRLYALAGGALLGEARALGLEGVSEVFVDRGYGADGHLLPRGTPGALLNDEEAAVVQLLSLVRDGGVHTPDGHWVGLEAQTVCLHGDGPHALSFARRCAEALSQAGIARRAPA